jgi:alpha-tubulin suppressor-like RCC1 family protein
MLRSFLIATGMPRFATLFCLSMTILWPQIGFAQSRAAGGDNFTLLVTDGGSVWSFGRNTTGQLGLGHTTESLSPQQVPGLSNVIAVAAGGWHSLALTATGELYSWGSNYDGEVGNGSNTNASSPVQLSLANVVAIAAGQRHSLALTASGDLYAWGYNLNGQLGTGDTSERNTPVLIMSGISAIGAGASHSLAVKTDSTAWAWGSNGSGRLGHGVSGGQYPAPVEMIGISNAVAVYGGWAHSVVLLSDGTLKAAGSNPYGQLGHGTQAASYTAMPVLGLTNIQTVAVGWYHNLALDDEGSLWVWGDGFYGALGTGSQAEVRTPVTLSAPTSVAVIGAGGNHSVAIGADGIVSTWGSNSSGELGDGTTTLRYAPEAISASGYSWRVATPTFSIAAGTYNTEKTVIVAVDTLNATIRYTTDGSEPTGADPTISSGSSVTISQSRTLKAKAWKTGMPDSAIQSAAYTLQPQMPTITPSGGSGFSSAQTVSMSPQTSGSTIRFTLDGSDPTSSSTAYSAPFSVDATTTIKSAAFITGWSTSSIRTATFTFNYGPLDPPSITPATGSYAGSVSVTMSSTQSGATIRYTTNGTTPTASSTAYSSPIPITQTTTVKAKAFHSSYATSAETSRTYTLSAATPTLSAAAGSYAPGDVVTISTTEPTATLRMTLDGNDPTSSSTIVVSGTSFILGNFTLKVKAFRSNVGDSAIASAAYSLTSALGPGAVTTGGSHNVLATPDGRVYAWGNNSNGQIGNEATTDRPTPTLLNTITGVKAVASGLLHTLALTADGQVYSWGSNGSGRLGNNSTVQSTRPVHVSTLSNIIAIAAGDAHSLALTSDGHVFSWGLNGNGQLGLGNSGSGTDQLVPTEITTLSSIVAIAAGDSQSFAVTSGGQVYAWGANGNSRLGDGTTTQQNAPVLLGLSNIVSIAAGQAHTLALTSAGRVYGWGANGNGQLGFTPATTVATPTLMSNFHVSTIAAGDNHSGAIRADGALVMWGNSPSGQVGSGVVTATISTPTVVTGPSSVSTLSLGDLHSVAVTSTGDVWAWGESADYRLGNNATTPDKSTPQSILTGLSSWATAAPTINVASGTLGASTTVTLTSSTSGAVIRYTQNGSLPTESDTEVPANGQIEIAYSSLLRARTFLTGRQPGMAPARADYELQSAPPTITPGTGTYTAAQTVTITATGAPGAIRYTLDGSEPTSSSSLYSTPVGVSTGMTIMAKTFPSNGWSASTAASATLTFNYGVLETPVATPDGGAFQSAPQVTLSASAGAAIRYTTNGATPTESSTLYTGPLSLPAAGAELKAKAFRADWTPSAVASASFVVDTTPPSIVATVSPVPNGAGWNNSPVTISFTCSDNVNYAVDCPSPVDVTQDGAAQLISRTATDSAGNSAQASVTISIDSVAPTIELTSSVPADTTSTELVVAADVTDALSGPGSGSCSGTAASISAGTLGCTLPLKLGRNVILATIVDVAGNTASLSRRTVRITGDPIELTVTPTSAAILVDERRVMAAVDQFGRVPTGVSWSSSDETIATVAADEDGIVFALGVAPGTATLTADLNGETATMTLNIYAGINLPVGTPRWTAPARTSIAAADTIFTSDFGGPDAIYSIEYATAGYNENQHATVRSYGVDGTENWFGALPVGDNETIRNVMPHALGGVVAVLHTYADPAVDAAIVRYSGTDDGSWRYESGAWRMQAVTGGDGTVFVIEELVDAGEKAQLAVIDGQTGGVISKHPLPQWVISTDTGASPQTIDPVGFTVDASGHARFILKHGWTRFSSVDGGSVSHILDLYDVAPDGTVTTSRLDTLAHTPVSSLYYLRPESITPDADGVLALFVRAEGAGQEEQWKGKYFGATAGSFTLPGPWIPTVTSVDGYGIGRGTESTDSLVSRNLRTGAVRWESTAQGDPVVALDGGGAGVVGSSGSLAMLDQAGTTTGSDAMNIDPGPYVYGRFHFRDANNGLAAVAWQAIDDATLFGGGRSRGSGGGASWEPRWYGIWAKSHVVFLLFKHAAIRIVPRNQSDWLDTSNQFNIWFSEPKLKRYGDLVYATIGGGPSADDPFVLSNLENRFNSQSDIERNSVDRPERLDLSLGSDEDSAIERLFTLASYYDQNSTLDYELTPGSSTDGYNSNSYLRGLLEAAQIRLPKFPTPYLGDSPAFPGWFKPVPKLYFGIQP